MVCSCVFFSLPVYHLDPLQFGFPVFLSRCPHLRHYLCFLFINAALPFAHPTQFHVFHSPCYCFTFSSAFEHWLRWREETVEKARPSGVTTDDKNMTINIVAIRLYSSNDDCQFLTPSLQTGSQSWSTFYFICNMQTQTSPSEEEVIRKFKPHWFKHS